MQLHFIIQNSRILTKQEWALLFASGENSILRSFNSGGKLTIYDTQLVKLQFQSLQPLHHVKVVSVAGLTVIIKTPQ